MFRANSVDRPQKKPVIFLHMPKTAGTTFYDAIKFQYRKHEIFTCSGIIENTVKDEFQFLPDKKRQQIKFYKGHMTFGLHHFLDQPSSYITILRHPVNRFISLYHYLSQSKSHSQHHLVAGKSLQEFAEQPTAHHNFQTRFIAGKQAFEANCSEEDLLAIAKTHLDHNFAAVGIQEQFDETLILFKQVLDWKRLPLYVRQNVSHKPNSQVLSQSTLNLIEHCNALDMELYQYASQKFETQIQALGSTFQSELAHFKRINDLYAPVGTTYSLLRSFVLRYSK